MAHDLLPLVAVLAAAALLMAPVVGYPWPVCGQSNYFKPNGMYQAHLDLVAAKLPKNASMSRSLFATTTTREQTLERCPNLALALTFFAPGTKGSCPTVVRGTGIFSLGWYYQPGLKVNL